METATARMIEKNVFIVTKVSLPPARARLPTSLRRASTTKIVRPREAAAKMQANSGHSAV
jgi:hypothetical protein